MKLSRNLDKVLTVIAVFFAGFILSVCYVGNSNLRTFADTEDDTYIENVEHFVTFYDDGERLTVRTTANTVGEAISRVGIILNPADIVEPGLSEKIDSDNFFINIHRARPVIVKEDKIEKYIMTASYEPKTVAKEAGLTVYDGDDIKIAMNKNFLEAGIVEVYEIIRNGGRMITEDVEIPFEEETIKDYNLAPGVSEVRQLGEVGLRVLTYEAFYENNVEVERVLVSEEVKREPVTRIVAVGASEIERTPLTASMGRNRYTVRKAEGTVIERQETYYDLPMSGVMGFCGGGTYHIREDGAKVDDDGYVLVAAALDRYPRCSVVETSLGLGKVYDTGTFAASNPEQFDLATDWTNRDGR